MHFKVEIDFKKSRHLSQQQKKEQKSSPKKNSRKEELRVCVYIHKYASVALSEER